MRYNPTKDCSTYFVWPHPWDIKPWFNEPPKIKKKPKVRKEWEEENNEGKQKTIPYWRDLEKTGQDITDKDLIFEKWPQHRRNDANNVALPPHYTYAERFVKLTMGFPLGWRYRDAPMNLEEVRMIQKAEKMRRKEIAKLKKALKKTHAEAKKAKADKKGKK